jgi:hypothetical protein
MGRLRGARRGLLGAGSLRPLIPDIASPSRDFASRPGKRTTDDNAVFIEFADATPIRRRTAPRARVLRWLNLVRNGLRTPQKHEEENTWHSLTADSHSATLKLTNASATGERCAF